MVGITSPVILTIWFVFGVSNPNLTSPPSINMVRPPATPICVGPGLMTSVSRYEAAASVRAAALQPESNIIRIFFPSLVS